MALRTDRPRDWVAYGGAVGLMQLTHTLAFTVVLGQILATGALGDAGCSSRPPSRPVYAPPGCLCCCSKAILRSGHIAPLVHGKSGVADLVQHFWPGDEPGSWWTGAAVTILVLALPLKPSPSRAVARGCQCHPGAHGRDGTDVPSHLHARATWCWRSAFVVLLANLWSGPLVAPSADWCLVLANLAGIEHLYGAPPVGRQNWRGCRAHSASASAWRRTHPTPGDTDDCSKRSPGGHRPD